MAKVRWLDGARADYKAARAWYRAQNPQAALGFSAAVRDAVRLIARHPELYPQRTRGVRQCVLSHYNYSLIYRVIAGEVFMTAVTHNQQLPYWDNRN